MRGGELANAKEAECSEPLSDPPPRDLALFIAHSRFIGRAANELETEAARGPREILLLPFSRFQRRKLDPRSVSQRQRVPLAGVSPLIGDRNFSGGINGTATVSRIRFRSSGGLENSLNDRFFGGPTAGRGNLLATGSRARCPIR